MNARPSLLTSASQGGKSKGEQLPLDFRHACRSLSISPTRFVLVVNVQTQIMRFLEMLPPLSNCGLRIADCGFYNQSLAAAPVKQSHFHFPEYQLRKRCIISTSRFGIGQEEGSNKTPIGLHRIAEKIGAGWPIGTVFRARRMIGYTWQGLASATIVHRILWLDGLEPGFNRGGNVDTHGRYIYIHGLADEPTLGRPASHGCIHMAASDLLPLFDRVPIGTLVWIQR